MATPLDVSIYLNNALRPTHVMAELEGGTSLPQVVREMPEDVAGRFVDVEEPLLAEISSAWKKTMILNETQVLYTFTFDASSATFAAHKR